MYIYIPIYLNYLYKSYFYFRCIWCIKGNTTRAMDTYFLRGYTYIVWTFNCFCYTNGDRNIHKLIICINIFYSENNNVLFIAFLKRFWRLNTISMKIINFYFFGMHLITVGMNIYLTSKVIK